MFLEVDFYFAKISWEVVSFNFYTKTDTVFLKYKNLMKIDYDYKILDNGFVIEKDKIS